MDLLTLIRCYIPRPLLYVIVSTSASATSGSAPIASVAIVTTLATAHIHVNTHNLVIRKRTTVKAVHGYYSQMTLVTPGCETEIHVDRRTHKLKTRGKTAIGTGSGNRHTRPTGIE